MEETNQVTSRVPVIVTATISVSTPRISVLQNIMATVSRTLAPPFNPNPHYLQLPSPQESQQYGVVRKTATPSANKLS